MRCVNIAKISSESRRCACVLAKEGFSSFLIALQAVTAALVDCLVSLGAASAYKSVLVQVNTAKTIHFNI